jgi:hypothetical protein
MEISAGLEIGAAIQILLSGDSQNEITNTLFLELSMEWFLGDNPPATSNRKLVSSNGVLLFAEYSAKKKYWTSGDGMDCEKTHVDAWCDEPIPVIYMCKEIGEGEWYSCNKEWFEHCQKDPTIDTKTIKF